MGEWSKSVGEKGEAIVKFLFEDILGFNNLVENNTIQCTKGKDHKTGKSEKTTHGIDGLVTLNSPVEDYLLDIGVISSKFTKKYPKNPNALFKSHLKDLAYTIECFNSSKLKNDCNQRFSDVEKTEVTGILCWLSDDDPIDYDLVSQVHKIIVDNTLIFDKIILLDNNKANFLYESIHISNERFGTSYVDYIYHNSSLNSNHTQSESYGKIFPLNYLYSDVILLRAEKESNIYLLAFINNNYSKESLLLILSFLKSFNYLNSVNRIEISYLDYNNLENENSVKEALSEFNNYKLGKNLTIKKLQSDFRSR